MKRTQLAIVTRVLTATLLAVDNAPAAQIFNATLAGAQEVPAVVTAATGTVTLTLTDGVYPEASYFDIQASFSGLSSGWTLAGLYGPADAGQTAPLIFDVGLNAGPMQPPPGAKSGSFAVMDGTLSASLITALKAGRVYFNLRSATHPNGEIRGQLIPVDTTGPTGGTMTLTPATPVLPNASLTVGFAGWSDPTAPLSYAVLVDGVVVSAQGASASRSLTAPATAGAHTLKGRIYDRLNNVTEVTQGFTVNTAREMWRQWYFNTTANTGDAADGFDYDHDGLPNLIEWACNLNPTTASTLTVTVKPVGANLEFTYSRSVSALNAGAVFTVEWSDSPTGASWSASGVSQAVLADDGTVQQVKATMPAGTSGHRFAHLKVSVP